MIPGKKSRPHDVGNKYLMMMIYHAVCKKGIICKYIKCQESRDVSICVSANINSNIIFHCSTIIENIPNSHQFMLEICVNILDGLVNR